MTQNWTQFLAQQGLETITAAQIQAQLQIAKTSAIVTPLTDLGLIRASGEDAASFLHNLVTNDVVGLDNAAACTAGFCTAKGRLLSIFLIWREGNDYLLMLPREILPPLLKKLSMYVLRAKVKLSDATEERILLGISNLATGSLTRPAGSTLGVPNFIDTTLPAHAVAAPEGGQIIRLDDTRWLMSLEPVAAIKRWPEFTASASVTGLDAWHWLEILAGQPRVVAATQETFVPQMLNMELPAVAGVSFSKGCYPGQEIVARTHYLGKVKRRTYRAQLSQFAAPGTQVFAPETGDQPCGVLVSIAPAPQGGFECLVSVQSTVVAAGEVHLGAPDGEQLGFLPLPYPVE